MIQFLAGAPELLARYRNAPPAAAALIGAAMDARRLGMGAGLPHAFLEAAAPGYLTGDQWDALGEDWLEQALAYAAVPCKGARGPLTRIRPRPVMDAARTGPNGHPVGMASDGRAAVPARGLPGSARPTAPQGPDPPAGVLGRAAAHASPADQAVLGDAAHDRGLYRDAAQLHKNAAAHGNLRRRPPSQPSPGLPARATPAPRTGPPPTSPSTTRMAWPACWTGCGRRARTGRPPRWPPVPPPASPSTTRAAWHACWARCGRRARTSRSPRWPPAIPPPSVSLDDPGGVARLLDARAAGGGRGRAGHRAGRPCRRPRLPR